MTSDPGHDCRRLAALLDRALDLELTPEQAAFLEAHLDGCPPCRARRGFQERLRAGLDAALTGDALPEGMAERMAVRLEAEERSVAEGSG